MPASITTARVASSPNVAGSRRLMPASGPTPGSTPTSVPTTQPMKPYHSTLGESATEKPRARLWMVSSTSDPERPARQRHAQQRVEEQERAPRDRHREDRGQDHALALEHEQQEHEDSGHGEPVAEAIESPRRERARGKDADRVSPLVPADLAEALAARAQQRDTNAEYDQEQREQRGHVRRA